MWFEALVSLGGQWFPASVIQFFEREKMLHYYCVITYSPLAAHHEIVALNIILDEKRVFLARNIFKEISENTDIVHTIKRSLDELMGNKSYGVVLFDSQTQMLKDISTYSDYDEMESELMETQHSIFNLQDDLESELVETHHMVSEIKTIETKLLVSHQQTQSVAGLDDVNFSELNLYAEPSEGSFVITNFENVDIKSHKKTETEPKKGKHRPTLSFQASIEGFNLGPSDLSSLNVENLTATNTTSITAAKEEKQQKQKSKPKPKSKKQRHGEPGVVYDQLYSSIENGLMGLRFPKKIVDIIMQNYLEFQYFQTEKRLSVRDKNNPTLKLSTSGQVIYSSRIKTTEADIKRQGRGTWKIVSGEERWNVQVDVVLETEKKKPKIQPQNENLPKGVKKTHKSFMKAINKPITMTFPLRDYLNA